MADYSLIFLVTLVINFVITFLSSSKIWAGVPPEEQDHGSAEEIKRHKKLMRNYLIVYLLATVSDWLQGAYVYALYDAYGYTQYNIAILFVAGFGSSMIFGTYIGGMADWGGCRRFILIYTVIYGASCITKHFDDFNILIVGRLLAGIATSLLFSIFEAWLIRSHSDAKLGKKFLSRSFSSAAYGNAIVAIIAGLVANNAATATPMEPIFSDLIYVGGYLNPFDIALFALILCGLYCASIEEEEKTGGGENKTALTSSADEHENSRINWYDGLKNAFTTTIRSRDILLCGIISSLFEGSMYIFVFMWTPALKALSGDSPPPLGLIFSAFMVCCMAGSSLFSILSTRLKDEVVTIGVLITATISMILIATGSTDTVLLIGMLLFELCIGMYFPVMGILKGTIVPEDRRAAIYNLYRIPLNFIVLFSLLADLTPTSSFILNAILLSVATVLQGILMFRRLYMYRMTYCKERKRRQRALSGSSVEETLSLVTVEELMASDIN